MGQVEHQQFHPRALPDEMLGFAARLETHLPHFWLHQVYATGLARTVTSAVASEVDLDRPQAFLRQIQEHSPDVFAENCHLDPLAQIARALIQLKPRKILEAVFGRCPEGFLGLLARVDSAPFHQKQLYRIAFELCDRPENRNRMKALSQLQGLVRPEHILMASELDDVLVHRAVLERAQSCEIDALNTFVRLLPELCNANDADIRESLDQLSSHVKNVNIGEWVQSWLERQVRLPMPLPISANDPDMAVRIGAEQASLGRRFRNCAKSFLPHVFLGERVLVEWVRGGEQAVIDLVLIKSGSKRRWHCANLLGPRNRRVKPHVARQIRKRFDELGIFYEQSSLFGEEQQGLHSLIDPLNDVRFFDRAAARAEQDEVEHGEAA